MFTSQKWFSLSLKPKFLASLYDTYVRSTLIYGSELLTIEERQPLVELDDLLVRMYLKRLLKLKSITLQTKHKHRLMVLLRLTTMEMELYKRCMGRVDAWARRCESEENSHTCKTIDD